jgi:hypothetical protein
LNDDVVAACLLEESGDVFRRVREVDHFHRSNFSPRMYSSFPRR